MKLHTKFNLFEKTFRYLLRRALFRNREKFANEGLPVNVGLLNEYISIDMMVDGVYDLKSINEIVELLKSDFLNFKFETLIDIGANIGNHSVFLSKYFNNVIAFEPNPFTYEILKINASQYSNISIKNFGLSSSKGKLFLSEDKRNLGGSRIYSDKDKIPKDLIVSKNSILIKLDVEGHEINVLKGSKKFITKHNPVICFEQHASDFNDGVSPSIQFLSELNYQFYLFESKSSSYKFAPLIILSKILFGDHYFLKNVSEFSPDFYDSIIAVHPATIR